MGSGESFLLSVRTHIRVQTSVHPCVWICGSACVHLCDYVCASLSLCVYPRVVVIKSDTWLINRKLSHCGECHENC